MATIVTLKRKIQALNVGVVSRESIEATKEKIVEYNKDQLFDQGVNKFGDKLPDYASFSYASMKNKMNPQPGFGVPDLKLTGKFYEGFGVTVKQDSFLVTSKDSKVGSLVERYGGEIFGLSDESRAEYVKQNLRPVFMAEVRKITGL